MKIIKKFFMVLIIVATCIIAVVSTGCNVKPTANQIKVISYGGYEESLYAVWKDDAPQNAKAYYKEKSAENDSWVQIDAPLIRSSGEGLARVDALGLKAGEYNVKIKSSAGAETVLDKVIKVTAYDRSGYAHFQRGDEETASDGVGAYRDDGTVKDGALIVYVTEETKNDIRNSVYTNGKKTDISKYLSDNNNSIGYFLNGYNSPVYKLNRRYPAIAVRFIGKVNAEDETDCTKSLIEGLTEYSISAKDNGRMAQIINCHNITLEGVGTDAEIYGWGFSFYAQSKDDSRNAGTSFEVRNLTFRNYAEDAIGMEGNKKSNEGGDAVLACPVERCWIHNNSFYKGYCKTPADKDKGDGDGSVDFKRGQYYTLSYNYFEKTNKTCLVGASAETLQYNITMHHNWWNKCTARKPLVRRANLHFYNNYISEDISNKSYVTSLRANCLMFAEDNFYEGCADIFRHEIDSTEPLGYAKAYNNFYSGCHGKDVSKRVETRTEQVENDCKYGDIDYSSFDTDPDLFYYDADKQVSKCLLDTAEQAKTNVMNYAGVHGSGNKTN